MKKFLYFAAGFAFGGVVGFKLGIDETTASMTREAEAFIAGKKSADPTQGLPRDVVLNPLKNFNTQE